MLSEFFLSLNFFAAYLNRLVKEDAEYQTLQRESVLDEERNHVLSVVAGETSIDNQQEEVPGDYGADLMFLSTILKEDNSIEEDGMTVPAIFLVKCVHFCLSITARSECILKYRHGHTLYSSLSSLNWAILHVL